MSMEVLVPVAGILAVFAAMLVVLKLMRSKGLSFTARVFTALGLGVLLGLESSCCSAATGMLPRRRSTGYPSWDRVISAC